MAEKIWWRDKPPHIIWRQTQIILLDYYKARCIPNSMDYKSLLYPYCWIIKPIVSKNPMPFYCWFGMVWSPQTMGGS